MTLVVGKSAHQILLRFDGRVYKQTPYEVSRSTYHQLNIGSLRILPTADYM